MLVLSLPASIATAILSVWIEYKDWPYFGWCLNGAHWAKFKWIIQKFCVNVVDGRIARGLQSKPEFAWLSQFGFKLPMMDYFSSKILPEYAVESATYSFGETVMCSDESDVGTLFQRVSLEISKGIDLSAIVNLFIIAKRNGYSEIMVTSGLSSIQFDSRNSQLSIRHFKSVQASIVINCIDYINCVHVNAVSRVDFNETLNSLRKYRECLQELNVHSHSVDTMIWEWFPNLTALAAARVSWASYPKISKIRKIDARLWSVVDGTLIINTIEPLSALIFTQVVSCCSTITALEMTVDASPVGTFIRSLLAPKLRSLKLVWKLQTSLEPLRTLLAATTVLEEFKIDGAGREIYDCDCLDFIEWLAESPCRTTLRSFCCSGFSANWHGQRSYHILSLTHLVELEMPLSDSWHELIDIFLANLIRLPDLRIVYLDPLIVRRESDKMVSLSTTYIPLDQRFHSVISEAWWNYLTILPGTYDANAVSKLVTRVSSFSLAVKSNAKDYFYLFDMPLAVTEFNSEIDLTPSFLRHILENWKQINIIKTPSFALSVAEKRFEAKKVEHEDMAAIYETIVEFVEIRRLRLSSVVKDYVVLTERLRTLFSLSNSRSSSGSLREVTVAVTHKFINVHRTLEELPLQYLTHVTLLFQGPVPNMSNLRIDTQLLLLIKQMIRSRPSLRVVAVYAMELGKSLFRVSDFEDIRRPRLRVDILKS